MNEKIKDGLLQMAYDFQTSKKKQIRYKLVEVDKIYEDRKSIKYSSKKVAGYCALGMLGCKNKVFDGKTFYQANETDHEDILAIYGIKYGVYIPVPNEENKSLSTKEISELQQVIVRMNDDLEMTFKEIGDYIEAMVRLERIYVRA